MTTDSNNPTVRYLDVDADSTGQRLDNWLLRHLKGVPKSHLYRVIRKGEVRINKKRVGPDTRVTAGDVVRIPPIRAAEEKPFTLSERNHSLMDNILFEDASIIILNKPAGLPVHGGEGFRGGVIEVMRLLKPEHPHLELAHRLDKLTSGCLCLAKKRSVLRQIQADWHEAHKVEKIYQALVTGYWNPPKRVSLAIARSAEGQQGPHARIDPEGKEAVTHFSVLGHYKDATWVEARLETGRTHQIRLHAAHFGHPILGDERYGDHALNRSVAKLGLKHMALHASSLKLAGYPEFKAPIPDDWYTYLKQADTDA
ncbi:MAG: RluA family pseudouridine synthase [Pseudomonadota bacterium]